MSRVCGAGTGLVAWLVALAAPAVLAAPAPTVTIEDVAVQPRLAAPAVARVVVRVANPEPVRRSLDLRLAVWWQGASPRRADRFATALNLEPGESRRVAVSVLAAAGDAVEAAVHDPAGALVAQTRRQVARRTPGKLVVLLCRDEPVCQGLQSRIAFAGDDEDRVTKRKALGFAVVGDPPGEWWAYAGAVAAVLALPADRLTAGQREALELYTRQGGRLVLVEDLAGASGFLAAYRAGARGPAGQAIGAGRLFVSSAVAAEGLAAAFSGRALAAALQEAHQGGRLTNHAFEPLDELNWVRSRLAPAFHFPGAGWLVAWLAAYVAIVGPVSFGLLRRWGRTEWGWGTIPALALGFAGLLYVAGSAGRPRAFAVDEVTVRWMDDASPVAAADIALRVTAPWRATTTLAVAGDGVLTGPGRARVAPSFAFGLGDRAGTWDVRLASGRRITLPLRQWAYADVELREVRRLAGSVVRLPDGRLRNDTGERFAEAAYVDRHAVRRLGPLAAGALVDLAGAPATPLRAHTGDCSPYPRTMSAADCQHTAPPGDAPALRPFDLLELIRGWPPGGGDAFAARDGIFLGLAEGPGAAAELIGVPAVTRRHVVTVVSFRVTP